MTACPFPAVLASSSSWSNTWRLMYTSDLDVPNWTLATWSSCGLTAYLVKTNARDFVLLLLCLIMKSRMPNKLITVARKPQSLVTRGNFSQTTWRQPTVAHATGRFWNIVLQSTRKPGEQLKCEWYFFFEIAWNWLAVHCFMRHEGHVTQGNLQSCCERLLKFEWEITFFLKNYVTKQREPFLTVFYTSNNCPLLVTNKFLYKQLFWVITNSVQCL